MKKCLLSLLLALALAVVAFAASADINGDGTESLLDVIAALKASVAQAPDLRADMNGDGAVDIADVLVVLHRILNPLRREMTDVSKSMHLTSKNATMTYNNGKVVLSSVTQGGDGFATSDIYLPRGTAFTVQATMQITEGDCGGVTFGVQAQKAPSAAWYCVNVNRTAKNTRLFSVGIGTVEGGTKTQRPLTAAEVAKDTFTVKISVTEQGRISFYLDGEFVTSYDETGFAGGYLGFNVFNSAVTFSNVSVMLGECDPPAQSRITAVNGNWGFGGGTVMGDSSAIGDSFAMTDICVPAGKAFSVEAVATPLGGSNTGGIVFGVPNPASPASAWYCVNVNKSSARLFSVKTGTIGSGTGTTVTHTDALKGHSSYALRLTVDADGTMQYFVDGTLLFTREEPTFAGGYLGFNTFKSNVHFSDITVTVDGKVQPLSEMTLTAGDRTVALNPAATVQTVNIGDYGGNVTLCIPVPKGYTARVGTALLADGRYTFTPDYGKNRVRIDLRDEYARAFSYTVNIERDVPDTLLYTDAYRPKLHVTPPKNFMNDPNGLHYNATTGEYHTYYQWNPTQMQIGNQVWGHAVSKDLLHWTDHGIAVDRPADGDCIFSGCAVVDRNNTSGLFDESVAPDNRVVALYTITGPFRQELAYSTDGGYTFTKYAGNPVIASSAYFTAFRDPKVQWIEEKQLWLMVIAGGPMELYTSPDLIHWTSQGTMKYLNGDTITSECPMLLRLPLDGDENNIKYVYVGSGRFYVVGDLVWEGDSVRFVAEQTKTATMFYADPHYATQDFYNDAEGRVLLMSWMRDTASGYVLDGKYWNGVQSLPYETALVTENGRMALRFTPIAELEDAKGTALFTAKDVTLTDEALDMDVHTRYGIFDLTAKLSEGASLTMGLCEGEDYATTFTVTRMTDKTVQVVMDAKHSGVLARTKKTATVATDADGTFSLKIVLDSIVLEAFTSDGKVLGDVIFPPVTADGISLAATGTVEIKAFSVYGIQ